jgi:predicted transcriptional regulator of viral defense system
MLATWAKHGWLQKIRPGVYVPVELAAESPEEAFSDPWVIATRLFSPCYIGGWSACQYWELTEQIFDTTVILTSKRINAQEQTAGTMKFFIKKRAEEKRFGLKTVWKESFKTEVSDPHKTIVDILDDPSLGGGIRSVFDMFQKYLQSEHCNIPLLLEYGEKMKNKTIFKRMGYFLSLLKPNEEAFIDQCLHLLSKGYSQIDPSFTGHRLIKKWLLWLPEDFEQTLVPQGTYDR